MNPSPANRPRFPFSGFYIGPVVAALILSTGILAFVFALRDPLAAIMIAAINYIVHRANPNPLPIQQVDLVWQVQVSFAIVGVILLTIGLRLAFWVHRTSTSQVEK